MSTRKARHITAVPSDSHQINLFRIEGGTLPKYVLTIRALNESRTELFHSNEHGDLLDHSELASVYKISPFLALAVLGYTTGTARLINTRFVRSGWVKEYEVYGGQFFPYKQIQSFESSIVNETLITGKSDGEELFCITTQNSDFALECAGYEIIV